MIPSFASAYDDFSSSSVNTGLQCLDPSLTQQQFRDETDINTIVDTFMKTGVLPDPVTLPQYVDLSTGVFDYKAAQNMIRQADEAFMTMDAKVRARFHNSPHEFLEFFADPNNKAEAQRLGLIVSPPDKQSTPPQPDTQAAAPAAAGAAS